MNTRSRFLSVAVSVVAAALPVAAQERPTDEWLANPVDDRTLATYLDFFAYSRDLAFDTEILERVQDDGFALEHLTFVGTPGERVTAHLYQPNAAHATGRAVLLIHGGGPIGKDSPRIRVPATLLARAGFTVLTFDMKYWGERATDLLQTYTEQEKHERLYNQPSTYLAWVAQNVKDAGRAFDFLVEERGVDADRISLVGFSRGAQISMIVAGADPRFVAVVLIHGGHFDRLETGHLPAACPANYIGRISPRPLLMLNGRNDADYFPDTAVLPLQRLAGKPHEFRWTDSGHGIVTEEDRAFIVEWLRDNVP
jgi:dienelactone hydrolase